MRTVGLVIIASIEECDVSMHGSLLVVFAAAGDDVVVVIGYRILRRNSLCVRVNAVATLTSNVH